MCPKHEKGSSHEILTTNGSSNRSSSSIGADVTNPTPMLFPNFFNNTSDGFHADLLALLASQDQTLHRPRPRPRPSFFEPLFTNQTGSSQFQQSPFVESQTLIQSSSIRSIRNSGFDSLYMITDRKIHEWTQDEDGLWQRQCVFEVSSERTILQVLCNNRSHLLLLISVADGGYEAVKLSHHQNHRMQSLGVLSLENRPCTLTLSSSGNKAAFGYKSGLVQMWDILTDKTYLFSESSTTPEFIPPDRIISLLKFVDENALIVVQNRDKKISKLTLDEAVLSRAWQYTAPVSLESTTDTKLLFFPKSMVFEELNLTQTNDGHTVRRDLVAIRIKNGLEHKRVKLDSPIRAIARIPNSDREIAVYDDKQKIIIVDLMDCSLKQQYSHFSNLPQDSTIQLIALSRHVLIIEGYRIACLLDLQDNRQRYLTRYTPSVGIRSALSYDTIQELIDLPYGAIFVLRGDGSLELQTVKSLAALRPSTVENNVTSQPQPAVSTTDFSNLVMDIDEPFESPLQRRPS